MLVPVLLVGVPCTALAVLVAAFAITRRAVATAASALTAELPAGETVVARAAANCVAGGPRGMGTLVVTDRTLRFRATRASETFVVDRASLTGTESRRDRNRPVLAVTWPGGTAVWRTADPGPLADALAAVRGGNAS